MLTLIMAGLSVAAREYIRSEYMNESKPADGEIFRRVLDAERKSDKDAARHWAVMLTARKRRNLRELKSVDHGNFLSAIRPLLPFAALWTDFRPGALNRVLPMRCREVRVSRFVRSHRQQQLTGPGNISLLEMHARDLVKYPRRRAGTWEP